VDPELERLIRRLFRRARIDAARAVFGVGQAAFPTSWQKQALSPAIPVQERLAMYQRELIGGLKLLADQVPEFEGPDLDRLESEGIALLIAIRELRHHFPELGELSLDERAQSHGPATRRRRRGAE
jgi:hypothetical protein